MRPFSSLKLVITVTDAGWVFVNVKISPVAALPPDTMTVVGRNV